MKKLTLLCLACCMVLAGCSSTEQPQSAAPQVASVAVTVEQSVSSNEKDNVVICRSERPTGSHRPTKTCRTAAQIKADQKRVEQLRRSRDMGATVQGGGGN